MNPQSRTGQLSRYLSVAVFIGLLMIPLPWAVAVLAVIGVGRAAGPVLVRLAAGRRERSEPAAAASVVLGRDRAGRPVRLSDRQLAAHALIVGASGSGKTTTLLGILGDQIRRGNPVIALDLKGSPTFARELGRAAGAVGRELRIWTPDGPGHWNPLAHGNATALKDKLISTERFSEPHYMRAAERYVQNVLQVLHAADPGRAATLDEVVALMEPRRLSSVLRRVPRPLADRAQDYLAGLTPDQVSAVRGLGTRLALLSESSAGPYLRPGRPEATVDVRRALAGGEVVLFSLNSSVYGKLAAQLGALAIQDITSASGHRLQELGSGTPQATVAIDEFSALGADHVLALLARGREAGIGTIVATQELADLERAGRGFADQVIGLSAVKIIHRQDVPASAEMIAQMGGTERVWEETEQLRAIFSATSASRGSRRQVERFLVHPNEIKTLRTGEAVLIAKTPVARVTRLRVSPPARGPAPPPTARGPAPPPTARDPAPSPRDPALPPPDPAPPPRGPMPSSHSAEPASRGPEPADRGPEAWGRRPAPPPSSRPAQRPGRAPRGPDQPEPGVSR